MLKSGTATTKSIQYAEVYQILKIEAQQTSIIHQKVITIYSHFARHIQIKIHSFHCLSYDSSTVSSKASSPYSAI